MIDLIPTTIDQIGHVQMPKCHNIVVAELENLPRNKTFISDVISGN